MKKQLQNNLKIFLLSVVAFMFPFTSTVRADMCFAPDPIEFIKEPSVIFKGILVRIEKVYLPVTYTTKFSYGKDKRPVSTILTFKPTLAFKGTNKNSISIKCADDSWCSNLKVSPKVHFVDAFGYREPYYSSNRCDLKSGRAKNIERSTNVLNQFIQYPKALDQLKFTVKPQDNTKQIIQAKAKWYELWHDYIQAAKTWQKLIEASKWNGEYDIPYYSTKLVAKKLRVQILQADYDGVHETIRKVNIRQFTPYIHHAQELANLQTGDHFDAKLINFDDVFINSIELKNKDFRGVDFHKTTFHGADFSGSHFEGADLRYITISIMGSKFTNATYNCHTIFRDSHYIKAEMIKTDGVCKNRPLVTKE